MKSKWLGISLITIMVMLNACTPAMPKETMPAEPEKKMEQSGEAMMEKPTEAKTEPMPEASKPIMEATSMDMEKSAEPVSDTTDSMDSMMESPAWFSASMTDVSTGKPFTISDFKGKVVLVEAMAQWCSNCKKQQQQVLDLKKTLGDTPDLIIVGLEIDPNASTDQLKKYIGSNGFNWMYAVATVEVNKELASTYGTQFLNPPSTPMLVIDRVGKVTVLPLGTIKSANDLQLVVEPLLKEEM